MNTPQENVLENLQTDMEVQKERLDDICESVEKTRKYFKTMMTINVVVFILPLIALFFVVPWFLDSYVGSFSGLGL